MLQQIVPEHILFLDIETVPQYADYESCPEPLRSLWDKKAKQLHQKEPLSPQEIWPRAGIYAEFGRVICISAACYRQGKLWVSSFFDDDEAILLERFAAMLHQHFSKEHHMLCGHNAKEFDFPYLGRRMLIRGVRLPAILDTAGLKPWQVKHMDTMELWKFGDYKSYTSLELLACIFGIPTPKDDISGADVCEVYWQEKDLGRIVHYCEKDTVALARIFRKYQGMADLKDDEILFV